MKKSVILLILVVYIASLCIVGFFGIKLRIYDEVVKVEKIECVTQSESIIKTEGNPDLAFLFNDGIEYYAGYFYSEGLSVTLAFSVYPDNATNKNIEFIADASTQYSLRDNGDNSITITFNQKASIVLIVRAEDSNNAQTKIRIDAV